VTGAIIVFVVLQCHFFAINSLLLVVVHGVSDCGFLPFCNMTNYVDDVVVPGYRVGRYLWNRYNPRNLRIPRSWSAVPLARRPAGGGSAIPRMQTQIARISREVGKPERKYIDTAISLINVSDAAGAAQTLVSVAQGTGNDNRVGNKIRIRHMHVQVRLSEDDNSLGTTCTASTYVRCFIVQDTQQTSDTVPTVTDIFTNVALPQFPVINRNTQGRYKILKTFPLWNGAMIRDHETEAALVTPKAPTQSNVWVYKKSCNIVVTYNANAGTDVQKNGIFIVCTTNLAADTVDVDGAARLLFTDV